MSLPKRYGPPRSPGEKTQDQKATGRQNELRWSLRIGEITRVDYEEMVCDIKFMSGSRPPAMEVPISTAYWSKRGFLGAMPEKGALVVCGFMDVHEGKANQPLILSFLPNGSKTALRYHPMGHTGERDADEVDVPDEIKETELEGVYGADRHKMRKLYPGDVFAMSEKGSELLLNKNARLFDQGGSEFQLRSEDHASLLSSLDYYRTTGASRTRSGRIVRNRLNVPTDFTDDNDKLDPNHPLFDEFVNAGIVFDDGSLVDDVNNLPASMLPSGDRHSVITNNRNNPDDIQSEAFVEERQEIQELSDQRVPHGPEFGMDADQIAGERHFEPFIEKVSGTVVGNNPYSRGGRSKYGELLRPALYSSSNDAEADPRMEIVPNEVSEREKNLVAASLYRMKRPDGLGELFYSHDKEGHVFFSIPRSTSKASNLGAGRSVEGNMEGSTKLTMGANQEDNESLDVQADGGFKWNLGTINSSRRSLDVTGDGGIAIEAKGSDADGFAFNGKFAGHYGLAIRGDKGESIGGTYTQEVAGKKEMTAESVNQSIGTGSFTRTVMSGQEEQINGHVSKQIGSGESTTIVKPKTGQINAQKTDIKLGNRKTSFLAPAIDRTQFTTVGTSITQATGPLTHSKQSATFGSFSTQAPTGVYSVSLGVGSISMNVGAGAITLTSGVTIAMQSPIVSISGSVGLGAGAGAPNAVVGGVPGPSPHIDKITGQPLMGNPLVRTV